jgi:hypothetical protein
MTLAPEAVPIGRAAMAGIRATKGLPVGAATVYHGSPYRFQRFDPTKIGSGEGAQAYGYGHYVAESPTVAREYQSALSNKTGEILLNGKKFKPSNYEVTQLVAKYSDNPKELSSKLNEYVSKYAGNPYSDVELAQQAIKTLNAGGNVSPASSGSLYTIDLPDPAIARMLDWDKPLSEQPESVRNAMAAIQDGPRYGPLRNKSPILDPTDKYTKAEDAYRALAMELNGGRAMRRGSTAVDNSDRLAADFLRQAGIPGIRYLDQGSRSNFRVQNSVRGNPYGEPVSFMTEKQAQDYAQEQAAKGFQTQILPGTSNFVVFPGEEDLLRILSVEGGLLAP